MDISVLATKQKRLKDWAEFLENEKVSEPLKLKIGGALELYRRLITDAWHNKALTDETLNKMSDLERILEDFNEQVRLSTAWTMDRSFEK